MVAMGLAALPPLLCMVGMAGALAAQGYERSGNVQDIFGVFGLMLLVLPVVSSFMALLLLGYRKSADGSRARCVDSKVGYLLILVSPLLPFFLSFALWMTMACFRGNEFTATLLSILSYFLLVLISPSVAYFFTRGRRARETISCR